MYDPNMIINRWQATLQPTEKQILSMLASEGIETTFEDVDPGVKIGDHRHPFTEVRVVISGEVSFNIFGNQFKLRPGDRVEIPANTKHSHFNSSDITCRCVCGSKPS